MKFSLSLSLTHSSNALHHLVEGDEKVEIIEQIIFVNETISSSRGEMTVNLLSKINDTDGDPASTVCCVRLLYEEFLLVILC